MQSRFLNTYLLTTKSRIALIWHGASYHPSAEVRQYLDSVNQGLDEHEWKITCIRFAPNAPEQNPVEDIWLHTKKFVREFYHLFIICVNFSLQLKGYLNSWLTTKSLISLKCLCTIYFQQLFKIAICLLKY